MSELSDLLADRTRRRPADPVVTWYGPHGQRAELSAVTLSTAVAKTAGLLRDEWELEPGAAVRLRLPLHWQLTVWLAACDVAGLTVVWDEGPVTLSAGAVAADVLADDPEIAVVVAVDAFGLRPGPVPAGAWDHTREAMGQPDVLVGPAAAGAWHTSKELLPAKVLAARARHEADELHVTERLLVTGPLDPRTALASWAIPMVADATVVLVDGADPEPIAHAERATARLTAEP